MVKRHLLHPVRLRSNAQAVLALLAAAAAAPAQAIDYVWLGGNGSWEDSAHWQPGFGTPGSGDSATVNGGIVLLSSSRSLDRYTQGGGTLEGTGTLSVSGDARWTGGSIAGAGTHTFTGPTTITGNDGKTLSGGRTLVLSGNTTWGGNTGANGNFLFFYGGTLTNNATFTDANAFDTYARNYGGTNAFHNAGTYAKTGSGTTDIQVAFDNTGTTRIDSGTLLLRAAFTNQGTIDVHAGATVQSGNADFANASMMQGDGVIKTVASGALANRGTIAPGAPGRVGHLTLDGDLAMAANGTFDVDIASAGSFDLLSVADDVALRGILRVTGLPGLTLHDGDAFSVLSFSRQPTSTPFDTVSWETGVVPKDFGLEYVVEYGAHDVTLHVRAVPEPPAALLLALGVASVLLRRRGFAAARADDRRRPPTLADRTAR